MDRRILNQAEVEKQMVSDRPMQIWTINFTLVCLVNFMMFMSTQMLFPNVPLYLLTIGGDARNVGYVMGVYTVSAMLSRPVAGWLVDRYNRNSLLIAGIFLMLLTSLLYYHASTVMIMTGIRMLHGIFFGLASTVIGTIIVDILPIPRLNEGMGYFGLTSTLSMAMAPMLGFWLVGHFGYQSLFSAIAFTTGLAFLSSWLVRSSAPHRPAQSNAPARWSGLVENTALPASWVMFFLAAVYGALLTYIPLYAVAQGITNVGLFFTATAVTMLLARPVAGRWADGGAAKQVLYAGYILIAAGMLATARSQTILGFIWAGLLNGAGFGACMPVLQAQAVTYCGIHRRGAATGTFFALFDLGIGAGTIMWGYVAAASSYQTMYYLTLIPLVLATILIKRLNV
jgi:MFS family permease